VDPVTVSAAEDMAWLPLDDPSGAGAARRATEQLTDRLGFSAARIAEAGLAVTEIATNVQRHGGGGAILLRVVRIAGLAALEVVAIDSGPGIRDVAEARRDGLSTGGTLGIGMGAVDRLADGVDISSEPGRGTVIVARFEADHRARSRATDSIRSDGITRALSGETICGDAYAIRRHSDHTTLMVADGSGHGPLAAAASREAVRVFHELERPTPETALHRIHAALSGTRGAAVSVAELDASTGKVQFAGVGNVAGTIVSGEDRRSMVSIGGVAGYRAPSIRTFEYDLPPNAVVILHSDGVRTRWDAAHLGSVLGRSPLLIAATLVRDAGLRQDDACVVVGRVDR
jgi:anti-sigma regulatory factor (Ser/Thr protein kinase)